MFDVARAQCRSITRPVPSRRASRGAVGWFVLTLCTSAPAAAEGPIRRGGLTAEAGDASAEIATLPLAFHVVEVGGAPVVDGDWVAKQLADAKALFVLQGLHFRETSRTALSAAFENMETRADRDSLATEVVPYVVNVMIVGTLRDVDDPKRMRMGVHWVTGPGARHPGVRYIIVAKTAKPLVLAHELGHYFGNPHSGVPNNVMSYTRDGSPVFFDARQGQVLRGTARKFIEAGDLHPASDSQ